MKTIVTAVFAGLREADEARVRLLATGVPERCIALSTNLTADAVAAEFPGQTYSNQPGQEPGDNCDDALADTAHLGGCVVCVDIDGDREREPVERVLREAGGRRPIAEH